MLLCDKIDLDIENEAEVLKNAEETIQYLQNVVGSITKRVLDGEEIPGLKVVPGRRTRYITEGGYKYIAKQFGEDFAYETITKEKTLTKIEALLGKVEMKSMEDLGLIEYKEGSKKVVPEDEVA